MKRVAGITPLSLLLLGSYVVANTLASSEGEPILFLHRHAIPGLLVFVLGFLGVAGGVAASLALFMDLPALPFPPKD